MISSQSVLETLSYVKRYAGEPILIKMGGAALQDPKLVESLSENLALLRSVGIPLVIVHGGGPAINQELTTHGIEWSFIDGQRVTTPDMMGVIEMVLCGMMNRKIVRAMNQTGVKAVGVSGSDSKMLLCKSMSPALKQVGEIENVDTTYLTQLLATQSNPAEGFVPVVAPVGVGRKGDAFNINADWAASRIAQALSIKKLIYLTDQDGILDSEGKVISELDAGELEGLIEQGVVKGGMLAKANTMVHALKNGVAEIHILNAKRAHSLIDELFTNIGVGTICRKRSRLSRQNLKDGGASHVSP